MTILFSQSNSFSFESRKEILTNIIFETDDNYPHYGDSDTAPFHIFRVGREPVEILVRLLWRVLDNDFDDEFELYETISPNIISNKYDKITAEGLNVSVFQADNGFNVVSTIVRIKEIRAN